MDHKKQDFRSLTLRQMACALAAGDAGNVTAAARDPGVSPPSISAVIAGLEAHYGLPLFVRLPEQGGEPTSFGYDVLRELREILQRVDLAAALTRPSKGKRGVVALACYDALAPYLLPKMLRCVAVSLPGLTIRFVEGSLDGVAEMVTRETVDLGVTYDLGANAEIAAKTIYKLQPCILCAVDHPFATRSSVSLPELSDEDLILLNQPMSAQYVPGLSLPALPVITSPPPPPKSRSAPPPPSI